MFLSEMTGFLLEMVLAVAAIAWYKKKRKYVYIFLPLSLVCAYFAIRYGTELISLIDVIIVQAILKYVFAFAVITLVAWGCFERPFRESFLAVSEAYIIQNLSFYIFRVINFYVFVEWQYFQLCRWAVIIVVYGRHSAFVCKGYRI